MQTIRADEVNNAIQSGKAVWTWTDCGVGYLVAVSGYNARTGWLKCRGQSFLVCPSAECFIFDKPEDATAYQEIRRQALAARRQELSTNHKKFVESLSG